MVGHDCEVGSVERRRGSAWHGNGADGMVWGRSRAADDLCRVHVHVIMFMDQVVAVAMPIILIRCATNASAQSFPKCMVVGGLVVPPFFL